MKFIFTADISFNQIDSINLTDITTCLSINVYCTVETVTHMLELSVGIRKTFCILKRAFIFVQTIGSNVGAVYNFPDSGNFRLRNFDLLLSAAKWGRQMFPYAAAL